MVKVNPVNFRMTVVHEVAHEAIAEAVAEIGYSVAPAKGRQPEQAITPGFWPQHGQKIATVVSGAAVLVGYLVSLRLGEHHPAVVGIYVLATLVGGLKTFRLGLRALRSGEFDMNALMTIGVAGAMLIGEWAEAGLIAFLYSVSNWLEAATMQRTRNAIKALVDIAPKVALVRRDEVEHELAVEDVAIGDTLLVKPGEKIAMDGTVLTGASSVNQAPITGESIPVSKSPGSEVFAGSINGAGALEVRVTKRVEDTTLARIIHMVEEAQGERAEVQSFVDRFARRYTPVVLVAAVIMAVVPPLLLGQPWGDWIYRALALIVLACPCALVVSTPVALVAGIGNAARRGVLIKGGTHLEQAATIKVLAFDKTGTLTQGRPEVQEVVPLGVYSAEEVIRLAAAVEMRSEHPLAAAILRHATQTVGSVQAGQAFEAIIGHGAKAEVEGRTLYVGSPRYFQQQGVVLDATATIERLQNAGNTVVVLGDGQQAFGLIAVADPIRPESRAIVARLKAIGVQRVAMLTGDNASTAQAIAQQVGVDEVRAELLPEDKVTAVKELEARYGHVAMVGDGVNDAPALATASLGVAMGAAGTDVAIETADVALMSDDVRRIPFAIELSRKTMTIIRQNIAFSLGVKVVATLLVFPGWLSLWMAVVSDMGATILVVLNGLRLLAVRPQED